MKHPNVVGTHTPESYLNIHDEKKVKTLNVQEESPKTKRRVRRSIDNYKHPDVESYLSHNNNYYHSLNAFPRGSKFQKEMAMRGLNVKKNNFQDSLDKSHFSGGLIEKYRAQTNSDK